MPLSGAFASQSGRVDVLSLILLGWCGLPGPLGSITASAFLICRLIRSAVSSLASSSLVAVYVGVG